jgi:hypothetical protein
VPIEYDAELHGHSEFPAAFLSTEAGLGRAAAGEVLGDGGGGVRAAERQKRERRSESRRRERRNAERRRAEATLRKGETTR